MDSTPTDEEVVRRVRAGEPELFELLMRRNNQRVYRAVRSVLRDEAEAEDVMQQAYVLAFQHLSSFQGEARFSTWLIRIAVNEALGRRRRAARLSLVVDNPESYEGSAVRPPTGAANPEDAAASRELATLLERAIDALPDSYRTVFMLREVEGMSTAEAADALDTSEDAVKTRLHRAKAMLRQELDALTGTSVRHAFAFEAPRCDRVVGRVLTRLRGMKTHDWGAAGGAGQESLPPERSDT